VVEVADQAPQVLHAVQQVPTLLQTLEFQELIVELPSISHSTFCHECREGSIVARPRVVRELMPGADAEYKGVAVV